MDEEIVSKLTDPATGETVVVEPFDWERWIELGRAESFLANDDLS